MKTRTTLAATTALLAGLILLGTFSWEPARGQTRSSKPKVPGIPIPLNTLSTLYKNQSDLDVKQREMQLMRRAQLLSAFKKLRTAKDAAEKETAAKELSTLLKDQFDADLKLRENQIADIEARVKQLRSVLEKRRTARDEIIQLRMKVLVNEAEGLGFPTGAIKSGGAFFGDVFGADDAGGGFGQFRRWWGGATGNAAVKQKAGN